MIVGKFSKYTIWMLNYLNAKLEYCEWSMSYLALRGPRAVKKIAVLDKAAACGFDW